MSFAGMNQALRWYKLVLRQGLAVPYAQLPWRERIRVSRASTLDLRLGEAALLSKRLAALLGDLAPSERELLLGDAPQNDSNAERAYYKRRARLLAKLKPRFVAAGLLTETDAAARPEPDLERKTTPRPARGAENGGLYART